MMVLLMQTQVGKDMIPILHKLEQASSDEYVGTAAENLMEALRGNSVVAAKVKDQTNKEYIKIIFLIIIYRKMLFDMILCEINQQMKLIEKNEII